MLPEIKRGRGRPRKGKNFQASDLEFYRQELSAASEKQDLFAIAQAFYNIKELTGWTINKIAIKFDTCPGVIAKYLNVVLLPEPILNCWAARRMASQVALMFLKVNKELREPLFREMEAAELSFLRMDKLKSLFDRAIAAYGPKLQQDITPEPEPTTDAPALEPAAPASVIPFHPVTQSGDWKFGGLISEAVKNIASALDLSSNEIESELSSAVDVTRLRSALRQLIEQSEIGLSLLDHIAEAHKIRRSMLTYRLPVTAAHT